MLKIFVVVGFMLFPGGMGKPVFSYAAVHPVNGNAEYLRRFFLIPPGPLQGLSREVFLQFIQIHPLLGKGEGGGWLPGRGYETAAFKISDADD